jgi:6,7-dimethyl-8-ribityllumazine synthase
LSGRKSAAESDLDASRHRFAIVAARFNGDVVERLVEGAVACFTKHGARDVPVQWVPGAFELPFAAQLLAAHSDAVVALGCVIRGETPHFEFVSAEAARGVMDVSLRTGTPVTFGVLTTDDRAQADERSGGAAGNKGWDAAETAIEMATLAARLG